MQVVYVEGKPPKSAHAQVLAIGKFDGVHIGHQAILSVAKNVLGSDDKLSVMTFTPHPALVLSGKSTYARNLTPEREKVRQLESFGVHTLYFVNFTAEYAATSAETFVHEHLAELHLSRIVVGSDFRFGQGGKADVNVLKQLCSDLEIPVTVVEPVEQSAVKVSSSQIREHLEAGRVEAAEALLGRPYAITGTVVEGEKLGRKIGFPTANLGQTDDYVLPAAGVYAVAVELIDPKGAARQHWFGVANAGVRPTVAGTSFRVEIHLLGFSEDLYGKRLNVSFLRRIRSEQKFRDVETLKLQIAKDVAAAQLMLGIADSSLISHAEPLVD